MITKEEYKEVKDLYIENVKQIMLEQGGLFPHLTVFANHKKDKEDQPKTAIIHVPVSEEYMEDDDAKDEFISDMMPLVYKVIKEDFIPYGIAWASEAWMRVADKDFDIKTSNYKDLPIKKEVLLISIEMEDVCEAYLYEIKRDGKQVTSDGNLADKLELNELEKMPAPISGRFTGLYKKLNK